MIIKLTKDKWYKNEFISVYGYCFDENNQLMENENLITYFESAVNEKSLCQKLIHANGLFALIINYPEFQAIAIDKTRIYPLYFATDKNDITVSDDPHYLINNQSRIDETSLIEYNASGATFAGKTLINNIYQVKPSHYIIIRNSKIEQKKYYTYLVKEHELKYSTNIELDSSLNNALIRCITSIKKRQIVIPLSGGYDSRLIICILKRLNYKNVICYTVGRPNNDEYLYAKKVAEQLKYPHYFIDTTNTDNIDQDMPNNEDFIKYKNFIGNYSNFVWLYDYVAIKWLQKRNLVNSDAVFIPGHSGDSIAGSHLNKAIITPNKSISYLTNAILYDSFEYEYCKKLRKEIYNQFKEEKKCGYTPHSIYQNFILQNRQTHNIINSARIYEFFGYDVRLPLWDNEVIEIFRTAPYSQLENCVFYNTYVTTQLFKFFNVNFIEQNKSPQKVTFLIFKIKNRIKRFLPKIIINRFAKLEDKLGERELSAPLLQELINKKYYKNKYDYTSINEIIKDWYFYNIQQEVIGKK